MTRIWIAVAVLAILPSPTFAGDYRFAQNLGDSDAVLAFARDSANAPKLRIDPERLVIMGR